jgi:hypothetical protein
MATFVKKKVEEGDVLLPKQWRHWCRKAGLKPEGHKGECRFVRPSWGWFSLIGLGRRWRVNCYNQFSVSLSNKHFDRWARSHVMDVPMPKTEAEFMAAIENMRAVAKNADFDYEFGD